MARKFSHGPWSARETPHKQWKFEVRNTHRDPLCVVYSSEADARLMAASLNLLGSLKHLVAVVRMHEPLRASERAKLEAAETLIAEVSA